MKFIKSLHLKKNRDRERLFIAEGVKVCDELMKSGWPVHSVYSTEPDIPEYRDREIVTTRELGQISLLDTPNKVLAVGHMPKPHVIGDLDADGLTLVLDGVSDPGNLGAVMRSADWFGIRNLILLPGTVDPFNPKVVQASMGSVFRVRCCLAGIGETADWLPAHGPVYAAVTGAAGPRENPIPEKAALLLGSESHGLSPEMLSLADHRITIPRHEGSATESLNVAVAASILCYRYFSDRQREGPSS